MHMKNAKQMLEHLSGFAEKLFNDVGEVQPMWILESDKEIVPIVAPFNDDSEKDLAAEFVRNKAKEIGASVCGFMSEAWQVVVIPERDGGDALSTKASAHEDRREVIHIVTEDRAGGYACGSFFILRPEHGKATLSPFKVEEGLERIKGRFSSMLEKLS